MTLQLTDGELNRMARSRSRNLLAEIGRQTDDDLYGTAIKQGMIMKGVRTTPKSMIKAQERIAALPACNSARVWQRPGQKRPTAVAEYIFRSRATRKDFPDDGITMPLLIEVVSTVSTVGGYLTTQGATGEIRETIPLPDDRALVVAMERHVDTMNMPFWVAKTCWMEENPCP